MISYYFDQEGNIGSYNYSCNLHNGGLVAKIGNHSEAIIKFHADTRRLVWSNFFMIHVKVHMLIYVGNFQRERRFLQLVCNDITGVLRHFSEKESHLPKFLQTNKQSSVLEIIFFSNVVNFISNENFTVLFKTKGKTGK